MENRLDGPDAPITITCDCIARERREAANLLANPPRKPGRGLTHGLRTNRGLLGWLIFLALAALLFVWVQQSQPTRSVRAARIHKLAPERWSRVDRIAIGVLATGAACIVLMFILAARWARENRSRWDGRLSLAFDNRGVTQRRPGHTQVFRWITIRGFEEGRSVFVLRPDKHQAIIVPKRLFATDEQRDRLRELLRHHATRPAVPIPLGFEVGRS